jgi:hypothetical protein
VFQLAQATGQSVTDQPQRICVRQLTKQHRDKMGPTGKSSRMSFGFCGFHQSSKFRAGEVMKNLIKQTGGQYHVRALLLRPVSHPPSDGSDAVQHIIGGHFLFRSVLKTYLGHVWS